MALEPSGYANKLGNRYEGRWVVKQLLKLLREDIKSVTVEAIGDDEHGVDLLIEKNDTKVQFQQCKSRNASKEYWSVGDLHAKKIIEHARFQLSRDPNYTFALVSGVSGTVFGDICESARNSNNNPEDFYKYQIKAIGDKRETVFTQLCRYLVLDENSNEDRAIAFDFLKRFFISLWSDDQNNFEELLDIAFLLLDGSSNEVILVLADYAQSMIRKRITVYDLRSYLEGKGYYPRTLSHDSRVSPAIEQLQQSFESSIDSYLIGGDLIHRDETQDLLQSINSNDLIILHGDAGTGKSGVLYELALELKKADNAFLPVRLDRQIPHNTAKQYGEELGLPESPVHCLKAILNSQRGVLIIDQLDALRWTSNHSANSLNICKTIVREALSSNSIGDNITVILSCRTFDLEHDPEIKNWLKSSNRMLNCKAIEVKKLSEKSVSSIVKEYRVNYADLTPNQKLILSSPNHLAIWIEIIKQGEIPQFDSSTQLMRRFWADRYNVIRINCGIIDDEINQTLDVIVSYMEREGEISAPVSLVTNRQNTYDALCSYGILRTDGKRVTFCHQSYLDFRIADELLRRINTDGVSIPEWLGDRDKQSLFKREQLRQALVLLSDESPRLFLNNIKSILSNPTIRFHIKHLTLEVLRRIKEPSESLCEYLLELFFDGFWAEHIRDTVFWGHPIYVALLIERGIAYNWLSSGNETERNQIVLLLHSISNNLGNVVADFLTPLVEQPEINLQSILSCLCWNDSEDSDKMFDLRLKLISKGIIKEYIYWKELCRCHPIRVVKLLEAYISTWDTDRKSSECSSIIDRSKLERWSSEDMQALKKVAANNPIDVVVMLMPHVNRLTSSLNPNSYDFDWQLGERFEREVRQYPIKKGIVVMLCEAGKQFASHNPSEFLNIIKKFIKSTSPVIHEILIESFAFIDSEYSDVAIAYLLSDLSYFSIGNGYDEPEWMPASRLIKVQSPHCSIDYFNRLENAIISYHLPNEKKMAEYWLTTWKEDYYGYFWGQAQYFLLPSLAKDRQGEKTKQLIRVLNRRFDSYSEERFLRGGRGRGGIVCSPIPHEKLYSLSDKAWLGIVTNKKVLENKRKEWTQITPDKVAESTVRQFAGNLETVSKRFPNRFCKLATQFPDGVPVQYISAVLAGVKTIKPEGLSDEEKATWKPATSENIEAVLNKYSLGTGRDGVYEFCRLIQARAEEDWSEITIAKLVDYALNHPDLEPGELNVQCNISSDKATVDDLWQNSINCVRGIATIAIGQLLWSHPEKLEQLMPTLGEIANDPHPSVRIALLETGRFLLNNNKELAVKLFLTACKDDLRVAACPYAVDYFNCCIQDYTQDLSSIIIDMMNSQLEEVAEAGAKEVCARWMFYDLFEHEYELCRTGRVSHRKGLAEVASFMVQKDEYANKCLELLSQFYCDEDETVRTTVRQAFYNNPEILQKECLHQTLLDFIKSKTFQDDPTGIIYTFEEYKGSLLPFAEHILAICEQFSGSLKKQAKDLSGGLAHDASMLSSIVLRLYEQGKNNECVSGKCLDMWDMLFENRIGYVREMMKSIDS